MLAGRKLLLADDSATIHKVIDLTFADEGVEVVIVNNGQDAIDRLLDIRPDVVLADAFMLSPNGYAVCEYVKTHEQLKHIPVVLLVGSFEPFDEAEARRVGADDILTKPFQSIRRLIDRVGALVSSPPVEKESPTLELPHADVAAEEEFMDSHELEVTTADTLQLPEDVVNEHLQANLEQAGAVKSLPREENMETGVTNLGHDSQADQADVLLDLGEIEPVGEASDDFVLELDDDVSEPAEVAASAYEPAHYHAATAYESAPARAFVEPQIAEAPSYQPEVQSYQPESYQPEVHDSFADTQEISYAVAEPEPEVQSVSSPVSEPPVSAPSVSVGSVSSVDQLSPEMIDAIARRAVELMSDKVIREIAWEVVPDLAELLIKKQLEETK